ncbi:MAG: hypothetical protein J1F68_03565 [Clostridiales bacterium]|nr:hypothetical protein [Clostridiales bacterium]
MGRRVLAFFLGMLVGIVFLLGSVVAAVYITATTVTPDKIYPDSDKFLGDLANMTLYDIYNEISKLYKEKLGITGENGLYFTLGEFMERYHIDPVAAFGKPLPQDILDMPIFEFLGGSTDEAMKQMKASVMFSFVNFFTQTVDEEGNVVGGYFGESAITKLYLHTMAELLDPEKGAKYVFDEVLLSDIMPSFFPAEMTDDDIIMWAFGQSSTGRLMGGFEGSVLLQFKPDGAFETMGTLTIMQLMGNTSSYLNAMFGDKVFADLIDDSGNLIIDDLMNNMYLGGLLGYERKVIDVSDGYQELEIETDENIKILYKTEEGDTTYALEVDDVAYLAKVTCGQNEHIHTSDCYSNDADPICGMEENDEHFHTEECYIEDTICGIDYHAHDLDCIDFVWYNLSFETEEHEHTEDCYVEDNEVDGMMEKLASEKVKNLNNLHETVKKLTLRDVLGDDVPKYLKSIQNTKISELNSALDQMYLGEFLGYQRIEANGDDYRRILVEQNGFALVKRNSNGDIVKLDDEKWYPAHLNCKDITHGDNHDADCYDFTWFTSGSYIDPDKCPGESDDHEHTLDCYGDNLKEVEGMMSKLSSEKVRDLSNLGNTIKTFTLKDVMGADVPPSLKSIENTPVGQLGTAIDNMYLGEFLQYDKRPVDSTGFTAIDGITDVMEKDGIIIKKDGDIWYEAVFNCARIEQEHTHSYDCYDYVWYKFKCVNPDTDCDHSNGCYTAVDGLIGRLSRLKMNELSGDRIKQTVNETPIGDVLDLEKANGLLRELADVKIGNLSKELDALYVGVAMGYGRIQLTPDEFKGTFKKEISDTNPTHTDGNKILMYTDGSNANYYFYDALRDKYYVAAVICAENHEDDDHTFTCFGYLWLACNKDIDVDGTKTDHVHSTACDKARGLNAKIANLRIDELSGNNLTKISQSLTISDLIDSEMMTLSEENEKKLDKIFKDQDWRTLKLGEFIGALLNAIPSGSSSTETA